MSGFSTYKTRRGLLACVIRDTLLVFVRRVRRAGGRGWSDGRRRRPMAV